MVVYVGHGTVSVNYDTIPSVVLIFGGEMHLGRPCLSGCLTVYGIDEQIISP